MAGTSSNPVSSVVSAKEFERRRNQTRAKEARIKEADSDDFADITHAYAAANGLDPQETLNREREARANGEHGDPKLAAFHQAHTAKAPPAQPKTPQRAPTASPARVAGTNRTRSVVASSGSVLGGMIAYAIAINYWKWGPAGVRALFAAKYLNRVEAGPWAPSTGPSQALPYGSGSRLIA